jgi:hypothetical protein
MAATRLWRVLLAAAVLVAMQSSLLHPFEHLRGVPGVHAGGGTTVKAAGERTPIESLDAKLCEVCVAGAALGSAASASSSASPIAFSESFAASRDEAAFLAAFTPLFRSQAPPALL